MELRSQAVRKLAPENDPLKIGMGWKVDDLAKPQIMVESSSMIVPPKYSFSALQIVLLTVGHLTYSF